MRPRSRCSTAPVPPSGCPPVEAGTPFAVPHRPGRQGRRPSQPRRNAGSARRQPQAVDQTARWRPASTGSPSPTRYRRRKAGRRRSRRWWHRPERGHLPGRRAPSPTPAKRAASEVAVKSRRRALQSNVEDSRGDPLSEMPGRHRSVDDRGNPRIDVVSLPQKPCDDRQLIVLHRHSLRHARRVGLARSGARGAAPSRIRDHRAGCQSRPPLRPPGPTLASQRSTGPGAPTTPGCGNQSADVLRASR